MQVAFTFSVLIIGSFVFLLLTIYWMCKSSSGGPVRRLERTGGRPRKGEYEVTQGSYGYDTSYTPGNRASSAGPLPVGGRTDRAPTRSFGDYTSPRRKEREE